MAIPGVTTCVECVYWDPISVSETRGMPFTQMVALGLGRCRGQVPVSDEHISPNIITYAKWPITIGDTDWCIRFDKITP